MPPILTAINRFPVKSLRGETLTSAAVEPWGLAGDRRWMVVDSDGEAITAREVNRMLLLRPRLGAGGLVLSADGHPDLEVSSTDRCGATGHRARATAGRGAGRRRRGRVAG